MKRVNEEPIETQKTTKIKLLLLIFLFFFFFDQKCNLWFAMELLVNVNTAHGLNSVFLRGLNQQENTCLKFNVKRLIHYAVYCDY